MLVAMCSWVLLRYVSLVSGVGAILSTERQSAGFVVNRFRLAWIAGRSRPSAHPERIPDRPARPDQPLIPPQTLLLMRISEANDWTA
jgi:hypothetical protein